MSTVAASVAIAGLAQFPVAAGINPARTSGEDAKPTGGVAKLGSRTAPAANSVRLSIGRPTAGRATPEGEKSDCGDEDAKCSTRDSHVCVVTFCAQGDSIVSRATIGDEDVVGADALLRRRITKALQTCVPPVSVWKTP